MGWNIKKMGAHKKWGGLVMAILMGLHIFSGLRLFCPGALLPPLRALALAGIAPEHSSEEVAAAGAESKKGAPKCNCKKQKECPVIPRAVITSNPSQRFNEVQRQFKSLCCHSLVSDVTDYLLVAGNGPPLMQLVHTSFYSSTSLALTCVLLI